MKIGQKLILGFLGIGLLIGIVGYVGVNGIKRINEYSDSENAAHETYIEIAKLEAIMLDQVHEGMHLLSFEEESCIEATKKLGEKFRKQLEEIENRVPESKEKIQTIKAAHKKFEESFDKVVQAHYEGQLATIEQRREMHGKWCSISDEVIEQARGLQPLYAEKIEKTHKEEEQVIITTRRNVILASIAVVLLAIALGLLIARTISNPIIKLTEAADKISKGEIDIKLNIKSKDEIGKLAESFERMVIAIKIFKEDKK